MYSPFHIPFVCCVPSLSSVPTYFRIFLVQAKYITFPEHNFCSVVKPEIHMPWSLTRLIICTCSELLRPSPVTCKSSQLLLCVHILCSTCSYPMFSLSIFCVQPVRILCSTCSYPVFNLFVSCVQPVHILCSTCSAAL